MELHTSTNSTGDANPTGGLDWSDLEKQISDFAGGKIWDVSFHLRGVGVGGGFNGGMVSLGNLKRLEESPVT